jgi:hypothetical protein
MRRRSRRGVRALDDPKTVLGLAGPHSAQLNNDAGEPHYRCHGRDVHQLRADMTRERREADWHTHLAQWTFLGAAILAAAVVFELCPPVA